MDVMMPGATEVLVGFLIWLAVSLGAAVAVALDLCRRGVVLWWLASGLTLLVLPVGLVAYVSLRGSGRAQVPRRRAGRDGV